MWPDNDIDQAFQRLDPADPTPVPFPLDGWLRVQARLDQAAVARTMRRKLWRFLALELAAVAMAIFIWQLWPTPLAARNPTARTARPARSASVATAAPASRLDVLKNKNFSATTEGKALTNKHSAGASTPALPATALANVPGLAETATPVAGGAPNGAHLRSAARPLVAAPTPLARAHSSRSRPTARRAQTTAGATAALTTRYRTAPAATSIAPALAGAAELTDASGASAGAAAPAGAEALLALRSVGLPLRGASLDTPAVAAVAVAPPALSLRPPRWFVGLVVGSDVSTVKFAAKEHSTLLIGLTLEYQLTPRLRLSTGMVRVPKKYTARREDYNWADYPSATPRSFEWVEANCAVYDVPLNLRYDAVVRPRARVFGSLGLSSFVLQRERYTYDYLDQNQPATWRVELSNTNRNWLSVLNLSVGYEHSLGPHWRWQAEPYLKLPLTGIGAGRVALTSGGVLFGLKYGF